MPGSAVVNKAGCGTRSMSNRAARGLYTLAHVVPRTVPCSGSTSTRSI